MSPVRTANGSPPRVLSGRLGHLLAGAFAQVWPPVDIVDQGPVGLLHGWSGPTAHVGVRRDLAGAWMNRESWDDLAGARGVGAPDSPLQQWLAADPTNVDRAADVAVPLIPHDLGVTQLVTKPDGSSEVVHYGEDSSFGRAIWPDLLDEAASGVRDAVYRSLGASLARYGPATVYARLWWEMNEHPTDVDPVKFRAAWARAIPLIRAGFAAVARPGQRLRVVYCPAASGTARWNYLPDDPALVDVLAFDLFGGLWATTPPAQADVLAYVQDRLDELTAAGAELGKPVALGEWGGWAPGPADGVAMTRGLGDFPELVDLVADWATQPTGGGTWSDSWASTWAGGGAGNGVAYLAYFDLPDGGVGQTLTDTPLALERLRVRFPSGATPTPLSTYPPSAADAPPGAPYPTAYPTTAQEA